MSSKTFSIWNCKNGKTLVRKRNIATREKLAAPLSQSLIFRGLRLYSDGDRELSTALFEYGGALFSLILGSEVQVGCEARNFRPTDEQIESFQNTALEHEIDRHIYSYVQSVTTARRKVTIPPMLVEIKPKKIGFEPIGSEELKIQNLVVLLCKGWRIITR